MVSRLYSAVVNARNALYRKGVFKSYALGAKTISIGNITVGGTGKTPFVALVAEILAEKGEKVCILTRGYGRENPKKRILVSDGEKILTDARITGDEPLELAQKLGGKAIIVADADRVAAGNWAREKFGVTVFVLDDAFQHRRAKRDLDIVLLDATNPFGSEKTLPSGILRESLENLRRADAIVITRANLARNVANLQFQIKKYNADCPVFIAKNKIARLIDLKDFCAGRQFPADLENLQKRRSMAFCALGNPNNFFEQLRQENFNLIKSQIFPDHHFYTRSDLENLSETAKKANAEILLTTAKDAVKLKDLQIVAPCFVVENDLVFDPANDFPNWLLKTRN